MEGPCVRHRLGNGQDQAGQVRDGRQDLLRVLQVTTGWPAAARGVGVDEPGQADATRVPLFAEHRVQRCLVRRVGRAGRPGRVVEPEEADHRVVLEPAQRSALLGFHDPDRRGDLIVDRTRQAQTVHPALLISCRGGTALAYGRSIGMPYLM